MVGLEYIHILCRPLGNPSKFWQTIFPISKRDIPQPHEQLFDESNRGLIYASELNFGTTVKPKTKLNLVIQAIDDSI